MKPNLQPAKIPRAVIEAKLRAIVADILDADESTIQPYSRFREDLGADSLDLIMLIMALSKVFAVEICDAEVIHIQTFGEAIAYLERYLIIQVNQTAQHTGL